MLLYDTCVNVISVIRKKVRPSLAPISVRVADVRQRHGQICRAEVYDTLTINLENRAEIHLRPSVKPSFYCTDVHTTQPVLSDVTFKPSVPNFVQIGQKIRKLRV
jgi:hypothetical protein